MNASATAPVCTEHPAQPAGWSCADCQRRLCPACVAAEDAVNATFDSCVHCDGRASLLWVPGSRDSYREIFFHSLRVPIGWMTATVLLAVWMLVYFAWRLPLAGSGLVFVLLLTGLWGLFFAVLKTAQGGFDQIGASISANLRDDILRPALGMAAVSWGMVALVWLLLQDLAVGVRPDEDLRAWVLVLALAVLAPAWVIALARGDRALRAIAPSTSLGIMRALGNDYAYLAVVSAGTISLVFLWLGAGKYLAREQAQGFALLLNVFALYAVLLLARLCGLLMAARADALGGTFREDQVVPALPGAMPSGVRRRRAPPPPARPRQEFVELDTEVPSGPLQVTGFGDVDPLDHALGTFAAQSDAEASTLAPAELIQIGQRAAARGRLGEAIRALKLAASLRPDDGDAPRACVILARIYAERLNDTANAEKLYRFIVHRYPGTSAATYASQQLPPGS